MHNRTRINQATLELRRQIRFALETPDQRRLRQIRERINDQWTAQWCKPSIFDDRYARCVMTVDILANMSYH